MTAREKQRMQELHEAMQKKDLQIKQLEIQNEELIKAQEAYQAALKAKIDYIKSLKGIRRWLSALTLLWDIIATVEKGFSEE